MSLNINNKFNITLCGMMGSGKSSIGKFIEHKAKKSIENIFNEDGEIFFRNLEEQIIIEHLDKKKLLFLLVVELL